MIDDSHVSASQNYFLEAYNKTVKFPKIVAVILSKPEAPSPIIVPLELCDVVPGQFYKKRLPAHLTSEAVSFGTTRPEARWKAITGNGNPYSQTPVRDHTKMESGLR